MDGGEEQGRVITFRYWIRLETGKESVFEVKLAYDGLGIIADEPPDLPEWTLLEYYKCPNCPLDPKEHEHCPVAANLTCLIEFFRESKSFDNVDVRIETEERNYTKCVPLQTVASSLMGIYMVTSGCPVLNKMRPMVQTHLPFATWEETLYRIISMYLMAQYFLNKRGKQPDWDLHRLVEFFQDVYTVNNAFFKRLDSIRFEDGDTSLNAVSILNAGVNLTSLSIEADDLKHWEDLFLEHWG